ncbi:MAG: hypothetical protein PHE49_05790 [bacterium]|nr:hypothetical protein [bacterium]
MDKDLWGTVKKHFIPVIILIFLGNNGFAKSRENIPSRLFLSGNIGLGGYENLAKAKNHPFVDSSFLIKSNGCYGLGIKLEYSYSLIEVGIIAGGQIWGYTKASVLSDTSTDTSYSAGGSSILIPVGIHTLPSKWPVQVIPEVGFCCYNNEYINKGHGTHLTYNEEIKKSGTMCGISCIYYRYLVGGMLFFKGGYFFSNLPTFKINTYYLQCRLTGANSKNKTLFFGEGETGFSMKTDGRKSFYISFGFGLNLLTLSELGTI